MRVIRNTGAALLTLMLTGQTLSAQCISEVRQIAAHTSQSSLVAGPIAWSGNTLAIIGTHARNKSLFVSLYDERGNLLYPAVRLQDTEAAEIFNVVWNGDHFGIFYRTSEDELMLRRISTTGELLGPAVEPLNRLEFVDADQLDVIWSPRLLAYVIARTVSTGSRQVWLTTVGGDGVVRKNENLAVVPATDSYIHVAETDSGVIGVVYEQDATRNVMLTTVYPDPREMPNGTKRIWNPGAADLVLTDYDNQFVLARSALQSDEKRVIRWQMVDTLGFETRDDARLLVGTGKDTEPLSLISNGSELAITYLDSRGGFDVDTPSYRLRRFNPISGEKIADTLFAAADRVRHRAQTEHDLVWTGTSYMAAAVRELEEGDDSFLLRMCPLYAGIEGPTVVARGTPITLHAIAQGGVPGYEYTWTYGERGVATGNQLNLTLDFPGNYNVTLTATDETGTESTETRTITVFEPLRPKPRAVRK